ncbi:MAG: asparagine synthase (glutamine-hydrolyzing) [bacterium]|nr:asparagine synthase (glutamine-hydrolyzing) [bacterium]
MKGAKGMCGICGFVGDTKEREQVLARMMRAIRHRGPDGSGTHLSERVALGFQRLSIIDPEHGIQPMYNETGKKVLLFNGEIYNYQRLREELIRRGHRFRSQSDSEVLLHGYEEYGAGLLEMLRGMFAFVIWDEETGTLFAARDFFGIKPFYYRIADGAFVFASEIKSILEYPGYRRKVNERALEQYLSFQYSVLEETFFQGIFQLPPGHYLIFRKGKPEIVRYFGPELIPEPGGKKKGRIRELREVLKQSAERHLVSDVEVGCFLSGGVDSGLLAALSGCREAFTVGFQNEGAGYDETGFAGELAKELSVSHHCRYITKKEFWEALPEVVYYLDEPLGDASAAALYFLSQEASGKVKTVLSGEGSDELFGGYNIYREPDALRFIQWLPAGMRKRTAAIAGKIPGRWKGKNYLIRGARGLRQRYIGNAFVFRPEEKDRLLKRRQGADPEEVLGKTYDRIGGLSDSDQMQSIDLIYWLPGDILKKADRMSMAHSLEVRVPFLDLDVYEAARRLPRRMKIRRRTTKYALRRAARGILPGKVSVRGKLGFPIPIRNWLREEGWYLQIREAFLSKTAEIYFQREYLLKLLREHRTGEADHSRKLWTVYIFLLWHRIYFEEEDGIWNGREE